MADLVPILLPDGTASLASYKSKPTNRPGGGRDDNSNRQRRAAAAAAAATAAALRVGPASPPVFLLLLRGGRGRGRGRRRGVCFSEGVLLLPLPSADLPRPPGRRRGAGGRAGRQAPQAPVRPPAGLCPVPPRRLPSSSSSSSPSDSSSAYLSLNITLLFTADNPNKVGIRYGPTAFDVMYRGVPLGVAAVPGFEQPAHSTRLVQTRFSVDRFNVLQSDALDLLRDAALNDRVDLRLTGDVDANIRLLGFTSPRVRVSVDCAIAISPRRQSLTYKQCGVDGVNL
uniref:Late embryogenesis abundant protein LEA-2 subgroup domain-containing protein n=1 Tax=Ananas comosus var. bracteatus TaxID=296719 RepID=A0A6V7Q3I7_ANACO|nr:unnamed protein product [Ananas comosus var. bracteatus]